MVLNIPETQRGRQAMASLAGYAYQIYASVSEWSRIGADDVLLLEIAEDYATLAQSVLSMTQVKNEPAKTSVTLRSDGPIKALNSLWAHQAENPKLNVRLSYLTTAKAGRENGFTGPSEIGGITYWRRAAAGADVAPIRNFLLGLPLAEDLLEFVREADDEAIRTRLLKPVRWECESESLEAARDALEARLICIAADRGLLAPDGQAALPALVDAVLSSIVAGSRQLTCSDFESAFASAATMPIGRETFRALSGGAISGSGLIDQAPVDVFSDRSLPTRLAARTTLVDELASSLKARGALWLHGSSGLGKTLLARLIVARSERKWHIVELRTSDAADAERRLRTVLQRIGEPDFGGIVLDDLTAGAARANAARLSAIAQAITQVDGLLIVTSDRVPGPLVLRGIEPATFVVKEAQYLNVEDVCDIVGSAGGDSNRWAKIIHLTCGGGHPQLVDARVVGLASREWPNDERFDGLVKPGAPAEIAAARDEITIRLLAELSSEAHEFLLRLSLVIGWVDRDVALAVAGVEPSIGKPGAWFDLLVGPWIEIKGDDLYSVSPLVTNEGAKAFDSELQSTIHRRVVDHLIKRRPFPAWLLNTLLAHSLASRHTGGFMFVAGAFMTSGDRSELAKFAPLLPLLSPIDGKRLVPEDPVISASLRLAQLIVVASETNHPILDDVVDGAFAEFSELPLELASGLKLTGLMAILGSPELGASSAKWMPLLLEYERLQSEPGPFVDEMRNVMGRTDLGGLSPSEFFFLIRSRRTNTVGELETLFQELEKVPSDLRRQWLSAGPRLLGGSPLFIQNAWSQEAFAGTLDANLAVEQFRKLTRMAEIWAETEIAIECVRSEVVMLDEYLNDTSEALAALDVANATFPSEPRLARARATVLAHAGRHDEAHQILAGIVETYSTDEPIERALMLRSAAISAAKIGAIEHAVIHFRDARDVGKEVDHWQSGTRTGLLVDIGLMELERGNKKLALQAFATALEEADQLDPSTSDIAWYTVHVVPQVLDWVLSSDRGKPHQLGPELEPGLGSLIAPKAPNGRPRHFPQRMGWYLLAQLEARWNIDGRAIAKVEEFEEREGSLLPFALQLTFDKIDRAIGDHNLDRVFNLLLRLASYLKTTASIAEMSPADRQLGAQKLISKIPIDENSPGNVDGVRAVVAALISSAVLAGDEELARVAANRASIISQSLGGLFPEPRPDLPNSNDTNATAVSSLRWLHATALPGPDDLLVASCRVFAMVRSLPLRGFAQSTRSLLVERWLEIARIRPALLRFPRLTVPSIEEAALSSDSGVSAIAKLILAAANGTSVRLGDDMRSVLIESADRAE